MKLHHSTIALLLVLAGCQCRPTNPVSPTPTADQIATLRDEVASVERNFAQTMADRDLAAFGRLIADDAVFLNGGRPLRGREAIIGHWSRFFSAPEAPFSWEPDLVEVNAAGNLAQSIGPVKNPAGAAVARFYSTWRRESDGKWRIVFDNGYALPPVK